MQPPNEGSLRTLGRALLLARTVRGLKRRDISQRTGLSYPYLSQIERGVRTPSSRALQSIADALDMTTSELLSMADHVAEATPDDAVRAAAAASSTPPRPAAQPSAWFHAGPAAAQRAELFGSPPEPQAQESSPSPERATDDDLASLVAYAQQLSAADVRLLTDLARRLRG
jgi:transcriptional regulator with XRE-family HTH domain